MSPAILAVEVPEGGTDKHIACRPFFHGLILEEIGVSEDDNVLFTWKCFLQSRQFCHEFLRLSLAVRTECAASIGFHVDRNQDEVGQAVAGGEHHRVCVTNPYGWA